jgi:hypothetical protein
LETEWAKPAALYPARHFQQDWPLADESLGLRALLTNGLDWIAEQVVTGYSGQQQSREDPLAIAYLRVNPDSPVLAYTATHPPLALCYSLDGTSLGE